MIQALAHRLLLASLVALVISACTSNDTGKGTVTIDVVSTETECQVALTEAPAGTITFDVQNDGSATTEFYLYAADGSDVVGEVEDIGPGLTRSLTVQATAGSYVTACKPGMTGDGIRAGFEVVAAP